MSRLLTIYSKVAFAEYYLPRLVNDDYSIKIDNAIFNLPEPVELNLEAVDSEWYIKNDGCLMPSVGELMESYELSPDKIFSYGTDNKHVMFIIIVSERENAVHAYEKIDITKCGVITIGGKPENMIQFQFHGLISAHHAVINWSNGRCLLKDISKNGVFVNNRRCTAETALCFGDIINIYGLTIVYLGECLAIDMEVRDVIIQTNLLQRYIPRVMPMAKNTAEFSYFKRSPRMLKKLYDEPIEIEGPPAPQKPNRQPLLHTVGPLFTMMLPMVLGTTISMASEEGGGKAVGIIVSLASACVAAVWAVVRLNHSKREENAGEENRVQEYGKYIKKKEDELNRQAAYNAKIITERYPGAAECTTFTQRDKTANLWNRNLSHSDMLYVRLGLGDVDFQAPIHIPKERFSLSDDPLADYPLKLQKKYEKLHGVPVGIDLMEKSIVGLLCTGNRAGGLNAARSIIAQIAANNCYTDVKLVFLYDEAEQAQWQFARWLPHTWSQDGKERYIASDKTEAADVFYALSDIFREREALDNDPCNKDKKHMPHYVVILADPSMIENEAISKYLLSTSNIGVTTLYISEAYDELPNECTDIIECSDAFNGIYDVSMMQEERMSITYDVMSVDMLDRFARSLSNFKVAEIGAGGELPNSITFFDMYGVKTPQELNILERWRKSKTYETMRAMIGVKGGGAPIYLDIHERYRGPHGMVAGTTGSGKSETLQSYMLSVALNYSPLDVGFFVIDYKGGGMANLFNDLPHMMGTVTNLSGNQVKRAMISIKSEIKRRQRIFAEYDVNNIGKYTRLYKNKEANKPVPHLIIVIDEFAELKKEQPEFMSELISVAQVGRSLGIHLILSTQKPGNVVDDNIRSNSKFRLCMRVQDKCDSNDMIQKPDAAYITQTGRGYLQVGNDEIFELFQSGWSGATYDENAGECKSESAYLITKNGHKIVGKRQKMKLKEQRRRYWTAYIIDIVHECKRELSDEADLLKSIYGKLKTQGIEYPESAANDRKFRNLIEIDAQISAEHDHIISGDEAATTVLNMAEKVNMALPDEKEKTQLTAVVEHIAQTARQNGIKNDVRLWLPVLAEHIALESISDTAAFDGAAWAQSTGEISAVIGLADDPENQSQFPVGVDFTKNGHLAVCGGVLAGKSTFIQTLLYSLCSKYDPETVNIYALDFSNKMLLPFAKAPHVGAVLTEDDADKLAKLCVMLKKELESRKKLMMGGSYAQYIQKHKLPAVILVIDGYASMREKTSDAYEEQMTELAREGASYGMYIVIASGGFGVNDIKANISDKIQTVIGLSMGDKFKYADIFHTTRFDVLPEEGVRGRGLIMHGGRYLEFQTALAIDNTDDYMRGQMIESKLEAMAEAWNGPVARRIPVIPEKPTLSELMKNAEFADAMATPGLLPIGYRKKDAGIYSIPLGKVFNYFVVGKPKSGKTNMLRITAKVALQKDAKLIYVDPNGLSENVFEDNYNTDYYAMPEEYINLGKNIIGIIKERNEYKNELLRSGAASEEIQRLMEEKYTPVFIIIDDLNGFVKTMYDKKAAGDVSGFFENLADKGDLHNMYIIAGMQPDDFNMLRGKRFAELLFTRRVGMLLGSAVAEQNVFAFDDLPYKTQAAGMKANNGAATMSDGNETVFTVIPSLK